MSLLEPSNTPTLALLASSSFISRSPTVASLTSSSSTSASSTTKLKCEATCCTSNYLYAPQNQSDFNAGGGAIRLG
jgi:hypothetical protein